MNKRFLLLLPIMAMSLTSCSFLKNAIDKITGGTPAFNDLPDGEISDRDFESLPDRGKIQHIINQLDDKTYQHYSIDFDFEQNAKNGDIKIIQISHQTESTYPNGASFSREHNVGQYFKEKLEASVSCKNEERYTLTDNNSFIYQFSGHGTTNEPNLLPEQVFNYLPGDYQYSDSIFTNDERFTRLDQGYNRFKNYLKYSAQNGERILDFYDGTEKNAVVTATFKRDKGFAYTITTIETLSNLETNKVENVFTNEFFIKDGFIKIQKSKLESYQEDGTIKSTSKREWKMSADDNGESSTPLKFASSQEFPTLNHPCLSILNDY